jgi:hypothetical protein
MAKLYGFLESERGKPATKMGHRLMESTVQCWEGGVHVQLRPDGKFEVWVAAPPVGGARPKARPTVLLAEGYVQAYLDEGLEGYEEDY